jgi:hypothetical protein
MSESGHRVVSINGNVRLLSPPIATDSRTSRIGSFVLNNGHQVDGNLG